MVDDRRSGPPRDLWVLPSEELPPGAAAFLDMVREAARTTAGQPAGPEAEAPLAPVVPLHPVAGTSEPAGVPHATDAADAAESDGAALRPMPGSPATGPVAYNPDDPQDFLDAGARLFLEMVERAGTVRPLRPAEDESGVLPAEWTSAWHGEGAQHTEAVLHAIEQAMRHVSQSDAISEEVRARLLDLFTDFAVRRPWKGEEGRQATRPSGE